MNKIIKIFALIFTLTVLSACNNGGGSSTTTAQNMNADCVNYPQNCNANYYQQNPGFYPYGGYYNYGYNNPINYMNNSAYLCNCPAGTMPTYNTYSGLGCVQTSQVYSYGYAGGYVGGYGAYAYFGFGANNQQWVNIPQVSNYSGYPNSGCYNGVVQSCLVGQPTGCSAGYTCRAQNPSSRLGLCVSNNSTYSTLPMSR